MHPKGPKDQTMGYLWFFYIRNRNNDFGNLLCIGVLGPLGRSKPWALASARNLESSITHFIPSQNKGPYSKAYP